MPHETKKKQCRISNLQQARVLPEKYFRTSQGKWLIECGLPIANLQCVFDAYKERAVYRKVLFQLWNPIWNASILKPSTRSPFTGCCINNIWLKGKVIRVNQK
jgi:hypothetical protein